MRVRASTCVRLCNYAFVYLLSYLYSIEAFLKCSIAPKFCKTMNVHTFS